MLIEGRQSTASQNKQKTVKLGVIIVAYGYQKSLPELIDTIIAEKQTGDQVVIIDNHPDFESAKMADTRVGVDFVFRSENIGFAAACNLASKQLDKTIGLILFINPDIVPKPGALTALRLGGKKEWGAWMGLLLLPDGTINTDGNIVHISGLSWCGGIGQPPVKDTKTNTVDSLSGGCLMIRKGIWDQLSGFNALYFMYYEDTDLSFMVKRLGYQLGIVQSAKFVHDYTFIKGRQKWFYLERNRYIFIANQWPLGVIIVLLPVLLLSELGFWLTSIKDHRFVDRLKAIASFCRNLPKIVHTRRQLNRLARIDSYTFITWLRPNIETRQLSTFYNSKSLNKALGLYYTGAKFCLSIIGQPKPNR